jgi:hypothetical protein
MKTQQNGSPIIIILLWHESETAKQVQLNLQINLRNSKFSILLHFLLQKDSNLYKCLNRTKDIYFI